MSVALLSGVVQLKWANELCMHIHGSAQAQAQAQRVIVCVSVCLYKWEKESHCGMEKKHPAAWKLSKVVDEHRHDSREYVRVCVCAREEQQFMHTN